METTMAFKKLRNIMDYDDLQQLQNNNYLDEFYGLLNDHFHDPEFIVQECSCYFTHFNIVNEANVSDYIDDIVYQFIQKYKHDQLEEEEEEVEGQECELCSSRIKVTKHHAIPKLVLKRLRHNGKDAPVIFIYLCRQCHDQVHKYFTHLQLAKHYTTAQQLLHSDNLDFQQYIARKKSYVIQSERI